MNSVVLAVDIVVGYIAEIMKSMMLTLNNGVCNLLT